MSADLLARLRRSEAEVQRLRRELALAVVPDDVSVGRILVEVSAEWCVDLRLLRSNRRTAEIAEARQAVMGLARELTDRSLPEIGRVLRRDHTTVLAGARAHARRVEQNPNYAAHARAVAERIERTSSHA